MLIPGFAADHRIWDGLFDRFAEQFTVVRYDTRGFGRSSLPTEHRYSHARDLRALLDRLNITRAHIVGQSMGGEIAIEFTLAYPDAVDSLILVDSALGGYQWSAAYNESFNPIGAMAVQSGFPAAVEPLMAHSLHAPLGEQLAAALLRQMLADYSGWHMTHADPCQYPNPAAIQQLERIATPTLVMSAERSLPDFHAIADLLANRIPNARKATVPGVGRVLPLEAPEQIFALAVAFIAENSP